MQSNTIHLLFFKVRIVAARSRLVIVRVVAFAISPVMSLVHTGRTVEVLWTIVACHELVATVWFGRREATSLPMNLLLIILCLIWMLLEMRLVIVWRFSTVLVVTWAPLVHIIRRSVRRSRLPIGSLSVGFSKAVLVVEIGTMLRPVRTLVLGVGGTGIFIAIVLQTIVVHHILISEANTLI